MIMTSIAVKPALLDLDRLPTLVVSKWLISMN